MTRIGFGYDAHRLVTGRALILGGVTVPFEKGLLGHSDADVILHALCDAILGACALKDIGHQFPDTDPKFRGISSLTLLERVMRMIKGKGFMLFNADVTLLAEAPKVSPFIDEMVENISRVCKAPKDSINIKATTTEGLGFAGRGEGMAAYAVVTVTKSGP